MRMGVTISRVRQHEEIVYHVVEAYERDCLQAKHSVHERSERT